MNNNTYLLEPEEIGRAINYGLRKKLAEARGQEFNEAPPTLERK